MPLIRYDTNSIRMLVVSVALIMHSFVVLAAYERHPDVSQELWDRLTPYFLPEDHPIKSNLDELFSERRVSYSSRSLFAAGFKTPQPQPFTQTIVSRHTKLRGYLVKLYTDKRKATEWAHFLDRIHGAEKAKESIKKLGYQKYFKVPKKWIYPLPIEPSPPAGHHYHQKYFILVVEDAKPLNAQDNEFHWHSFLMTKERLFALHQVIQDAGLADSLRPKNVPFTKDGKMAFVDTEYYGRWPIQWDRALNHLTPEMQEYWNSLH